jgi:hypothetical protein
MFVVSFRKVLGVYVKWDNEAVPPIVTKWNVKILDISKVCYVETASLSLRMCVERYICDNRTTRNKTCCRQLFSFHHNSLPQHCHPSITRLFYCYFTNSLFMADFFSCTTASTHPPLLHSIYLCVKESKNTRQLCQHQVLVHARPPC